MKSALASSIAATLALLSVPAFAGTFTVLPLTGDADSGITADGAYTHAINVFDGANVTINGAVFTGSGGGANPGTNDYSTGGLNNGFTGFGSPVTGNTAGLMTNFLYNGNPETVTLNNLRVGQNYLTTFYNSAFGPAGDRFQTITASDLGTIHFDQNGLPGSLLQYAFTAASNTMTFTITPDVPGNTFHQYGFSNQIVGYKALLTDNFYAPSNPDTNNVNFNLAARQGGSLVAGGGPISYVPVGNTQVGNPTGGIDSGNYLLSAFGARTAIDHNFKGADSAGGLSISFDFAPNSTANGDTTFWQSLLLGMANADKNAAVNDPVSHFGILFRGNGEIQAFDGNSLVSGAERWTILTNVTNELNHIEILATDPTDSNPFDGLGETDIAVYSNGSLIYSFVKGGGGYADDFINFGNIFIGGADNVLIAQIPEPASLGLLAVGGLALLRRRRQGRNVPCSEIAACFGRDGEERPPEY